MTSDYKYRYIIGGKDKKLIPLLLSQGKGVNYVCNKYGLSKRFITNKYYLLLKSKGCVLGAKKIPYYLNEMDYGKIPSYKWTDLNKSEINFYHDFNK